VSADLRSLAQSTLKSALRCQLLRWTHNCEQCSRELVRKPNEWVKSPSMVQRIRSRTCSIARTVAKRVTLFASFSSIWASRVYALVILIHNPTRNQWARTKDAARSAAATHSARAGKLGSLSSRLVANVVDFRVEGPACGAAGYVESLALYRNEDRGSRDIPETRRD
jgi:hypothetical protein